MSARWKKKLADKSLQQQKAKMTAAGSTQALRLLCETLTPNIKIKKSTAKKRAFVNDNKTSENLGP